VFVLKTVSCRNIGKYYVHKTRFGGCDCEFGYGLECILKDFMHVVFGHGS
jgi:hypothetical protein